MAEQRFLRSPQSAAAQPPPPNPNRTGMQVNWGEAVGKTIKIRHHYIEAATKARFIRLKKGFLQVRDAQLALGAEVQQLFTLRPERPAT